MDKQLRIERRKQAFTARIVVSAFLFVSIGSPYAQAQNKVREFRSSRVDKRPVLEFQSSGVEELKSLNSQTLKLSNSSTLKLSKLHSMSSEIKKI